MMAGVRASRPGYERLEMPLLIIAPVVAEAWRS